MMHLSGLMRDMRKNINKYIQEFEENVRTHEGQYVVYYNGAKDRYDFWDKISWAEEILRVLHKDRKKALIAKVSYEELDF